MARSRRWLRQPQTLWLRKALFQVHLWTGLAAGVYILVISATGSALVYRDQLFMAATRRPIIAIGTGPRLTDDQLRDAAVRAYEGYSVENIHRMRNPDQAVDIRLRRGNDVKERLFDPYTGKDLGASVPFGIWFVSKLLELHDDLLGGRTGRRINALGALLLLVLAVTGIVIWWPGIKTWRRGLIVHRGVGWKRFTWELHSMIGFWSLGFVVLFGITGLYLGNPEPFQNLVDYFEPITPENAGERIGDQVVYWLAYLHFGRLGGRGIPGCGLGWCNSLTKAVWAVFGIAPAVMFVTGAIIWWNRILAPRRRSARHIRAAAKNPASV